MWQQEALLSVGHTLRNSLLPENGETKTKMLMNSSRYLHPIRIPRVKCPSMIITNFQMNMKGVLKRVKAFKTLVQPLV